VFSKSGDAKALEYSRYRGDPYTPEGLVTFAKLSMKKAVCDTLADAAAVTAFIGKHARAAVGFYLGSTELFMPGRPLHTIGLLQCQNDSEAGWRALF
jgi:hypothetical protein